MQSLRAAARVAGVSRPVVTDWIATGAYGAAISTPSGTFVSDEAITALSGLRRVADLDDIHDPVARKLLQDAPCFVARCRPETERLDGTEGVMGFDAQTVAGGDTSGIDRWWSVADATEEAIREGIEELSGWPFVVTVRGLVVHTAKIICLHRDGDYERDVRFDLEDTDAAWAAALNGVVLQAGGGPRQTYWPHLPRLADGDE